MTDPEATAAHGADDAPSAHVGSDGDGQCTSHDHPELRSAARGLESAGDEGQRDDTHGLLGIVGAVRKRDQRR